MMNQDAILEGLKSSVTAGHPEEALKFVNLAIEQGVDPVVAFEEGLTAGMTKVGEAFACQEMFLPDLILAAKAMKAAAEILEKEINRLGVERKGLGKVVLGTVAGDIHDIGKSIVNTLLTANGFEVIDLGIDVTTDSFVKAANQENVTVVGMCSMLTTTAPEMTNVIEALEEAGIRDKVKVMVGGASITQEYADQIGADGYGDNAEQGVRVAKSLLKVPD
jgi:corrinoid protein of di/trimethylamine methyltransferase